MIFFLDQFPDFTGLVHFLLIEVAKENQKIEKLVEHQLLLLRLLSLSHTRQPKLKFLINLF